MCRLCHLDDDLAAARARADAAEEELAAERARAEQAERERDALLRALNKLAVGMVGCFSSEPPRRPGIPQVREWLSWVMARLEETAAPTPAPAPRGARGVTEVGRCVC